MEFGGGGQHRNVKREVIKSKQWARKRDLYENILKGCEQGKAAFVKAEEKGVLLITMQNDNSFSQNRGGCIFEKYLGQGSLQT